MTDTNSELAAVLETLSKDESDLETTVKELERLRKQIAVLENRRVTIRTRLSSNKKTKETLERRVKIEAEELRIHSEIEEAKERYQEILRVLKFPEEPFEHQFAGAAKFAVAKRALCADKRGLGKTLTAILWRHFVEAHKVLWLAPSKLALQADQMLRRWDGENGSTLINLVGQGKAHRDSIFKLIKKAPDVIVLLNYESWRRDKTVLQHLIDANFDAVVMDEVHNAKESNKLVAQGLFQLAEKIPNILQLTGTPILNRPQEIWSPLHMLRPDIFPTKSAFLQDFCSGYGNEWWWRPGGEEELAKKIEPFYLRRTRDSIGIKIPPPQIVPYELTFDDYPEQKRAYSLISERAIIAIKAAIEGTGGGSQALPHIFSILTRQRQMTVWPPSIQFVDDLDGLTYKFDVHQSVKMDFATDQIKELVDEGERVILFSNFQGPIEELESRLLREEISVAKYVGSTPDWKRNDIEKDFNLETAPKDSPRWPVLLATYKTIGEGLNLNAARHAILLDREWNPGREEQAIGRIDRLNSVDQATVHIPEVKDSIDEFMRGLIENKAKIVGGFDDATAVANALIDKLQKDMEK